MLLAQALCLTGQNSFDLDVRLEILPPHLDTQQVSILGASCLY